MINCKVSWSGFDYKTTMDKREYISNQTKNAAQIIFHVSGFLRPTEYFVFNQK